MPTSASLLDRARQRDDVAWNELVELYAPLVYFWCRKTNIVEQDIPDVVQEVFRAVVTGIDGFRKDRPSDTFRGWLRTVTRSKLSDHFRRLDRNPVAIGGSAAQLRMEHISDESSDSDRFARLGRFKERLLKTVVRSSSGDVRHRLIVQTRFVGNLPTRFQAMKGRDKVGFLLTIRLGQRDRTQAAHDSPIHALWRAAEHYDEPMFPPMVVAGNQLEQFGNLHHPIARSTALGVGSEILAKLQMREDRRHIFTLFEALLD